MATITVCRLDEMADGDIRKVESGSRSFAVVRNDGQVYALQNRCAHKGAPIGDGIVSAARNEIICPWHRFRFDLATGRCATNAEVVIRTVPVTVVDGDVVLDI